MYILYYLDPNNDQYRYSSVNTHYSTCIAAFENSFDVFKFTINNEFMELFKEYNEKYNNEKHLWDKFDVLNAIKHQFSDKNYCYVLPSICKSNHPEMVEYYITNVSLDEKILNLGVIECLQNKNYKCLDVLLRHGSKLLTLDSLCTIYRCKTEKDEYIQNELSKFSKEDYDKVYNEDNEFKLLNSAASNGFIHLKNLLDSGYKMDHHNKYFQSICQFILLNLNDNESVENLLEKYEKENMNCFLYGQYIIIIIIREDINGDILFDSLSSKYLNRNNSISLKVMNTIAQSTYLFFI